MKTLYERDLITEQPPIPYLYWGRPAIKKKLRMSGFDLNKTIHKEYDVKLGWYWRQK